MTRARPGAPPLHAASWRDDVKFMNETIERLKDRVPGIRWVKPVAHGDPQLLVWDGEGRHEEYRLGDLADWADAEWPA